MNLDFDAIHSLPWKQLIEKVIGVNPNTLEDDYWLVKLKEHLHAENIHNIDGYFEYLSESSYKSPQWRRLSHKLLNNTTEFFRHPPSFFFVDELVTEKLKMASMEPPPITSHKNVNPPMNMSDVSRKMHESFFSVWSVGCSTGEESYSLSAAVYHSLYKMQQETRPYIVVASDISEQAIHFAKNAKYKAGDSLQNRGELGAWRDYFDYDNNKHVEVKPRVTNNVTFLLSSILDKSVVSEKFDVIFCQNLLIYFRRWRVKEILNRLSLSVNTGGVLILGVGEAPNWRHSSFEKVDNPHILAFRKIK